MCGLKSNKSYILPSYKKKVISLSFVSIVARHDFITVMSDGRVTDSENVSTEEDYQKFMRTSKNSFLAYAGTKEACEMAATNILPLLEHEIPLHMIIESLPTVFSQLQSNGKIKILLAMGGVSKENKIELHTISSIDNRVQSYYPTQKNDIISVFLNNTEIGDQKYNIKFKELLGETGFDSPSEVIQAQKLLNNYAADNDISVNKRTFRLSIRV